MTKFQKGDIITNDHYATLGLTYEFVSQEGERALVLNLPDRTDNSFTGDSGLYLVKRPKFKAGDILRREGWEDTTVRGVKDGGYDILYGDGSGRAWRDFDYVEKYWTLREVVFNDATSPNEDMVNHPSHYTSDPSGVECIQITRHRNFNVGNAIKYLWRNGLKEDANKVGTAKQVEDLEKAIFYIKDEIVRLGAL